MKSETEIRELISYWKGYIAGQRNSHACFDEEVEMARYTINALLSILKD